MPSDAYQSGDVSTDGGSIEVGAEELAWSQAWQVPVLLLGLGLLVIGIYFALPRYPESDFPGVISDVEVHLANQELEQAESKLDTLSVDPLYIDSASDEMKAHVLQLYGDLRFYQIDHRVWQRAPTPKGLENLQVIEGHYRDAERLGRELPVMSLRRYAETLAALGEDQEALQIVDRMPVGLDPPRHRLVRDLIERRVVTDPNPESDQLARLIARFEQELAEEPNSQIKRNEQIWVMSLRCQRLLDAKDPDGVVRLLVEGGLLSLMERGATGVELAPLTVCLGEAYVRLNQLDEARLHLSDAQRQLPNGHPLNPRIMVAFGDITLAQGLPGRFEQAHHHYHQAYNADRLGPSAIDAMIGLGHTEANRDGRFPESLQWFDMAVQRMVSEQVPSWDTRRERLAEYLRNVHVQREYERGRFREALQLLQVYEPLELPELSSETLQAFASIYERLGERAQAQADALAPDPLSPGQDPSLQARRIHNQEAALNYEQAGRYYQRQAAELTHTTTEHGDALWSAARSYEKAQLWDEAVQAYSDFLSTSDRADRREEASFRIAQALLAEGQAEAAVQRFRAIIEESSTGEWAKSSYVPMAQGLTSLERWGEAENLLRSVTENHPSIGPDSPYFLNALFELGRLLYIRGAQDPRSYARAIEVLGEDGGAIERFVNSGKPEYMAQLPTVRYMLADSLRLSSRGLTEAAEIARTETERLSLLSERTRRLYDAQIYYNQVVVELEGWHIDSLSQNQIQYFRNAQFYQADCAFERGDYETAVGLYLNAVSRWQDHPVALVGWVQIMNARAEMGEMEAARSAHTRAIELFNQMPEGAFDRADSLMTRERWDDWLQWMTQLNLFSAENATAGVQTPD